MEATSTHADFDRLSWHDCHVWGFELHVGNPDEGDWRADLVFNIDFIVEWLCGASEPAQFRIAPAKLVFHGVTDPKLKIDWGDSGFQVAIHEMAIDGIEREQIHEQKVHLDSPYYRWRIRLSWPKAGEIVFGAVGFTQSLLAKPVLVTGKQSLSRRERNRLIGG